MKERSTNVEIVIFRQLQRAILVYTIKRYMKDRSTHAMNVTSKQSMKGRSTHVWNVITKHQEREVLLDTREQYMEGKRCP